MAKNKAKKKKVDPIKAKEARQKKMLLVGVVLLAGIMYLQLPKLQHKPPPPEYIASSTAATSGAAPAAGAAPAPATAAPAPVAPGAPVVGIPVAAAAPAAQLLDTDLVPPATSGSSQLVSFALFETKDPFKPQLDARSAVEAAPGAVPTAADTHTADKPAGVTLTPVVANAPGAPPAPASPTAASGPATPVTAGVTISVNGRSERIATGGTFPNAAPVFRLVSFKDGSAKIGVVGGSYEQGGATVTLEKDKPLTLMNTADGTRYRLVLVSTS